MTIVRRLFPARFDNHYCGHRAALWLLGLLIALTLVVSLNSMFNTAYVAVGADGFPLDSYGPAAARSVLMLFALDALGQLVLSLVSLTALIRYRSMVPFIYLLVLCQQLARRFIIQSYAVARAPTEAAVPYVVYGVIALLAVGLALSLLRRRQPDAPDPCLRGESIMASTAASAAPPRPAGDELSALRLHILRATYALIAFAQLALTGPALFAHEPTARGVIPSMIVGMCLIDLFGIKYPRQMLPMLLFEFAWKYIWFFAFGLPQWLSGQQPPTFAEDFPAITFGVVLMPLVIPWGYVWRQYVKAAGDRWR